MKKAVTVISVLAVMILFIMAIPALADGDEKGNLRGDPFSSVDILDHVNAYLVNASPIPYVYASTHRYTRFNYGSYYEDIGNSNSHTCMYVNIPTNGTGPGITHIDMYARAYPNPNTNGWSSTRYDVTTGNTIQLGFYSHGKAFTNSSNAACPRE